jgi:hypothetical protein
VLARNPALKQRYKRDPYQSYYGAGDLLRFPVSPLPPAGVGVRYKEPVLALAVGDARWKAFTVSRLAALADAAGHLEVDIGGTPVRLSYTPEPPTVFVDAAQEPLRIVYAFWFAWHATRPGSLRGLDTE